MTAASLYERLADHFSYFIVGAPRTDTLVRILQILFPPEEAEVALHMPVMHKMTPSDLQAAMPMQTSGMPAILDRMAARGTVQVLREDGLGVRYALLPSAKGWYDTPYWDSRKRDDQQRLAPLWLQYRDEAFGAELARGDMPTFRTLPIGRSLKHDAAVLPFDQLRPQIEDQSFSAAEAAVMDPKSCLGCGLCAAVCAATAIELTRREPPERPPDLAGFLARKLRPA